MILETLDYTNLSKLTESYSGQSTDDPRAIRIGPPGVQLWRVFQDNDEDMLYSSTISQLGSTTITGAASGTDWNDGKRSYILDPSGTQTVKISLGVDEGFYLKRLTSTLVINNNDTIKEPVIVEVSENDIVYDKLTTEIDTNIITAYPQNITVGLFTKYIKLTYSGSVSDNENITLAEVKAYKTRFINPYLTIDHSDYWVDTVFDGITATTTTPAGTLIKYQITMNGLPYYWNGSVWEQVIQNVDTDSINCNTEADINTNAATLYTAGESIKFGIRAILFSTEDLTPSIESITFS